MIAASSPECAAAMSARSGCPRLHGFRGGGRRRRGTRRKHIAGQQAREGGVHAVHGIADAHRRERVAVVSAADAQEPLPPGCPDAVWNCTASFSATSTATEPESARNTRSKPGRPGRGRGHVHQPLGQFHRRGMREAAEHHMAETLQLPPVRRRPAPGGGSRGSPTTTRTSHQPRHGACRPRPEAAAARRRPPRPPTAGGPGTPERTGATTARGPAGSGPAAPNRCVMVQAPRGGSIPLTSPAA